MVVAITRVWLVVKHLSHRCQAAGGGHEASLLGSIAAGAVRGEAEFFVEFAFGGGSGWFVLVDGRHAVATHADRLLQLFLQLDATMGGDHL